MSSYKQIKIFILVALLAFSFNLKSKAEIIPSTQIDTYTINLTGSELNNVTGLNLKIKLPSKKADITTGITFKGTGANVLLSTVTGPNAEEYTVSLVLTGMITDGKATIVGKFVEASIVKDAEFLLTSITRDGGTDLTSLLTKEITFSNSKATPTPTPTATPSPTASSSATPTDSDSPSNEPTPSASVVAVAESIVDLIVNENGELDIDPSELGETIANKNEANLSIALPSSIQLKKNGLNRIFLRLTGSIDREFIKDSNLNQLSCYVFPRKLIIDSDGHVDYVPAGFLQLSNPIFSVPIPKTGSKFRFSKRATVNVVPGGEGTKLLNNELGYFDVGFDNFCLIFNKESEEGKLRDYANSKGQSVNSLTADQLYEYFLFNDFSGIKTLVSKNYSSEETTLLAPEVVADTVPPTLIKIETDTTGRIAILTYSEALGRSRSRTENFLLNGVSKSFVADISGNKVTFDLLAGPLTGNENKLTYTGTSLIKDLRGNPAGSFSNISIKSNKETVSPTLQEVSIIAGTEIRLEYGEKLDGDSEPELSDFSLVVSGGETLAPTYLYIYDDDVTLKFNKKIPSGSKLNYSPGIRPIKDLAGNLAPAFTNISLP